MRTDIVLRKDDDDYQIIVISPKQMRVILDENGFLHINDMKPLRFSIGLIEKSKFYVRPISSPDSSPWPDVIYNGQIKTENTSLWTSGRTILVEVRPAFVAAGFVLELHLAGKVLEIFAHKDIRRLNFHFCCDTAIQQALTLMKLDNPELFTDTLSPLALEIYNILKGLPTAFEAGVSCAEAANLLLRQPHLYAPEAAEILKDEGYSLEEIHTTLLLAQAPVKRCVVAGAHALIVSTPDNINPGERRFIIWDN